MNKVKKFMIENKIYVLVLFLGIIAIIYGMMSLYDMFKEHSLIYFITINGIIVATIYVGIHEQKRRNEFPWMERSSGEGRRTWKQSGRMYAMYYAGIY